MEYVIGFHRRAPRDLENLDVHDAERIMVAIRRLRDELGGDVKRLTNHTPQYRLCVGTFRVLFEVERHH